MFHRRLRTFVLGAFNGSANSLRINSITASATGLALVDIAYINGDSSARTATVTAGGPGAPSQKARGPSPLHHA